MTSLPRRGFLRSMGSLAAYYPFSVSLSSAQTTPQAPGLQPNTPMIKVALVMMRITNSVEANFFAREHHYLSQTQLLASPEFREMADEFGLTQFLSNTPAGYVLPPYRLRLDLTTAGYSVLLVDMVSGDALKSDQQGLIFRGTCKTASGQGSFEPKDFVGEPLQRRRLEHDAAQGPVRRLLAATVAFFVPVVSAQCCGTCCCQTRGYRDSAQGPCACAPDRCCNVGILDCVWCCSGPGCLCCTGECNDP